MNPQKQTIDINLTKWEGVLQTFPRGPMGLTPDHIKATPAWKEAKRQYAYWFEQLREFNKAFLKAHKLIGYECVNGKRIAIYQPK